MVEEKQLEVFIKENIGVTPSKQLIRLIMHPSRLNQLNNIALKKMVEEYAPIERYCRGILDGPIEMQILAVFSISLMSRLHNKPDLQEILNDGCKEE